MTKSTVSPSPRGPIPSSLHAKEWDLIELSPVFDLQDLFSIIKRRFFLLLLFPFIGGLLAIFYLFFFATLYYSSTALIFIDPKFDHILQVENVASVASDLDSLNSLERTITSDSMILRVIDRLELRNDLDFLPKSLRKNVIENVPISDSRLLKEIRGKRVSCSLIRPTRLLELTVYDTDAERARLMASTFVSEFESFLAEQKRREANKSQEALRRQADIAYRRALEADKELERFRKENPGLTVEQDHSLFAERLTKVGEEYNRVSGKVLDLQSKVETVRDIDPEADPIQVIEIGGFSGNEHVTDLLSRRMNARAAFAVAGTRYTQSHPEYKQAEKQYIEVESQLTQLASDLKASLIGDYTAAAKNEELLTKKVKELQGELNSVKLASAEFRAVQQKVETEWRIHEALQQKISETSLLTEKSTSITTEMSEPIAAHKTSKPGKPVVAVMGTFLGGLFSLGLLSVDLLRDTPFVNRSQLEKNLGVKVLAGTPSLQAEEEHRTALLAQMSQVLLSPEHRLSRVVHVGSVEPFESGHHISSALGYASAYYGNPTLVISMIPGSNPETLVSFKPQKSHQENLFSLAIPSSFLLAPENIWQMLNPHCQQFSRIIIETTSLEQETQVPVMVSSYSDTTILIVRNRKDKRKKIGQVVDFLRKNARGTVSVVMEG
ncbi:MAG: Wzz/FepE/Etk N-terminal domain-containing protein [Verrucomicrobiales bacterium]|nr:Wzz/FepE/Etk N-terminal domain-containing protein [Verrucomicrobiales bacterium]